MAVRFKHVAAAEKYARDVRAGRIPACKWVKFACARHLEDRKKEKREDYPYKFDRAKADRMCKAVELLPHIKGKWAGTNLKLEPWQQFIVCVVFGWLAKLDNFRRFRTAYIEVPRKNAKSTLTAAIALLMLAADKENGAEVYSAATTQKQAKIVFDIAKNMARRSPGYRGKFGVDVGEHNINVLSTASKFEALSAEGSTQDGLNLHFVSVDEFHAHKSRTLFDVLETATGSRSQPLVWEITTAGSNRSGICYEQRDYLTKVLDPAIDVQDDSFFGIIYTIDEEDLENWTDPDVWRKANPNLDVSVYLDDLERLCRKAQETPSAKNTFLTKRLNVWVSADSPWMDMAKWDRCKDAELLIEAFKDVPCFVGYDLAFRNDIAARIQVFRRDEDYYVFGHYYLPEVAIKESKNSQYGGWAESGYLAVTEGNTTDWYEVEDDLKELAKEYDLSEVGFDPAHARQFASRMQEEEALEMVEVRPTTMNFSEPMKEIEALIGKDHFHHNGDPVLAWMASNVVCHYDNKDNIYPKKEKPENKIDGIIALIIAMSRAIAHQDDGPSPWDDPDYEPAMA